MLTEANNLMAVIHHHSELEAAEILCRMDVMEW